MVEIVIKVECLKNKIILQATSCNYYLASQLAIETTVKALVSDQLGNSEKWSQLEMVTYENVFL